MDIKKIILGVVFAFTLIGCNKSIDYSGEWVYKHENYVSKIAIIPTGKANIYILKGYDDIDKTADRQIEFKDNKSIIDLNVGFSAGSVVDENTLSFGDGGAIYKKVQDNK